VKKTVGFVVVLLLALSHLAVADPAIKPGIDVFRTLGGGRTYYDFAKNPIPAGFFCDSSSTFSSRVALRGFPVETAIPGQLQKMDTIIERLDQAVFDAQGVAETRIRFRALSMLSIAPIKTSCGDFHVYVTLAGKQPLTKMRIYRDQPRGGSFNAPLAANVRFIFVPVKGKSSRKLELKGSVNFPGLDTPWSFPGGTDIKQIASAIVDTNGDQIPDTRLPGTSNFAAGYPPESKSLFGPSCSCCVCHDADGEFHCTVSGPECQSCC